MGLVGEIVEQQCEGKNDKYKEGFVMGYLREGYEPTWYSSNVTREIRKAVRNAVDTLLPMGNTQPSAEMADNAVFKDACAGYKAGFAYLSRPTAADRHSDDEDDHDFNINTLSILS